MKAKYNADDICKLIGKAHTEKQIEKALLGIPHTKDAEADYYNIYIPRREDQCIRVYIDYRGNTHIQKLEKITMTYSGIPVFFGIRGRKEM